MHKYQQVLKKSEILKYEIMASPFSRYQYPNASSDQIKPCPLNFDL